MTQNDMPTSAVLNRAADLIEERGWTQGPSGWMVAGPKCALGSIAAAADVSSIVGFYESWEIVKIPAVSALAAHLDVEVDSDGQGIYRWNDAPDRTAEQVIATLRAAAVIEAARESKVEVTAL